MAEPDVFILADQTLNGIVRQIGDDQWSMPMPPGFAMRQSDHVPSLREIINYHAYDDAWVPDMLAGRTMEEVGGDRFGGDLLGDDPKASFAAIVENACRAAGEVEDLERTVHCSFGDFTVRALGVFPPAVPVPDDAPLQDRLLGITGRTPSGK